MAATNGFDHDAAVIGSGFGGSVAALRAVEKGYRVGVMESGKRWPDEELRLDAKADDIIPEYPY